MPSLIHFSFSVASNNLNPTSLALSLFLESKVNKLFSDSLYCSSNSFKSLLEQYKDEDIDNLSTYSKELAEDNIRKDLEIKSLTEEVNSFRSGKAYKEQNKIIANQKIIINQKDDEINSWKNKFEELADEFKNFKKRIQDKIYSLTSKIFEILHIPYSWYEANDIDYAIDTTRDYLKKHSKSKDDLER